MLKFGLSVRFGRYALNLYVALYAHLLNGSGDKRQLAGLQRDLALGIAHRARAGLGHQGHEGISIGQREGAGAVHTEGVYKAAVVEPVLVDEFGTDGGGVVGLVEAELEGELAAKDFGPIVAHQLGSVLDKEGADGIALLFLAVGEGECASGAREGLGRTKGVGVLQEVAIG